METDIAVRAPGGLAELDADGAAAWHERVDTIFAAVAGDVAGETGGSSAFVLPAPDQRTPFVTGPDWTGVGM